MRARSVSTRPQELSVFLLFLAATGCRRGEALAIAWPDIDLINGSARISKSLEQTNANPVNHGNKNPSGAGSLVSPFSATRINRMDGGATAENDMSARRTEVYSLQ